MEIYVVTSGEYSDYGIVTVFTDKTLAKNFCEKFPECEIETYMANEISEIINSNIYNVEMDKDGNSDVWKLEGADYYIEAMNKYSYFNYATKLVCVVFAEDEQHAAKIVNERRAQHIADNTWGGQKIYK